MQRLLGGIGVLLAATFVLGANAGQALASHLQCGDVITQDTMLDSDLINCPGDGLVIGADYITLDLNGHLMEGDGSQPLDPCDMDVGVANGKESLEFFGCPPPPLGHEGVTIKNGVVREFFSGVTFEAAGHGAVHGMTVSETDQGISLQDGAADNLLTQNSVSASRYGIRLGEAGPGNRVEGNSVYGNRTEGTTAAGIYVSGSADGNRIEENSVSNNDAGIFLSDSFGDTIIKGNSVSDNEVGIWLIESQHTHIEGNRVLRSSGINPVGFVALGDGIHLDDRQNEVVGNVASRNRDDGIEIALNPENTLARNRADRNGDLGIEAVPGVIDGGGNRAKHNGNPSQCLNVFCKTNAPRK